MANPAAPSMISSEGVMIAISSKITGNSSTVSCEMASDRAFTSPTATTNLELVLRHSKSPRLETFTVFPELPLEIRRMIWQMCLPRTRLIHVMNYSGICKLFPNKTLKDFKSLKGLYRNLIPVAFHINRESRIEALPKYALITCSSTTPTIAPFFYIKKTDRILLSTHAALNFHLKINWNDCCLSQLEKESSAKYLSGIKFIHLDSFCVPWKHLRRAKILSRHTVEYFTATPDSEPFCCLFKYFSALRGVFIVISSAEDHAYLSTRMRYRQLFILREVLEHHRHGFSHSELVPNVFLIYKETSKIYSFREWWAMKRAERAAKTASKNGIAAS